MNKEKKIGVSKITIQLGDKEATLTVEQARELQAALNDLLGETVVEVAPTWQWIPYGTSATKSSITWSTGNTTDTYTIDLSGDGDLLPV